MIGSSDSVFLWFVESDVSWYHLLRVHLWLVLSRPFNAVWWLAGWDPDLIHLIGCSLHEEVTYSRCTLVSCTTGFPFPISFFYFPGWSSLVDFLWGPDSFLLSGLVLTSLSLIVPLHEYFFVWRFHGHVRNYSEHHSSGITHVININSSLSVPLIKNYEP